MPTRPAAAGRGLPRAAFPEAATHPELQHADDTGFDSAAKLQDITGL